AIGRRKSAVATVRLFSGKGESTINEKPLAQYLNNDTLMRVVSEPQTLLGHSKDTYMVVRVSGGGTRAQADAIRLGIARAFLIMSEDFRPTLRKAGLLTRDAREKERKK